MDVVFVDLHVASRHTDMTAQEELPRRIEPYVGGVLPLGRRGSNGAGERREKHDDSQSGDPNLHGSTPASRTPITLVLTASGVKALLNDARRRGGACPLMTQCGGMAGLVAGARSSTAFIALTLMAVLASFYFALGRTPLFDVDEGAFSEATLEMFQRGDFLSIYLNGAPRYDKPVLIHWLQAASVLVFGANEFAFRFPSALCATLWALITFLFVRRRFGLNTALLAAGITATSLGVYLIARAATADALLNLLIAGTMFAAWLHLETGRRRWLYTAHATVGLGFLTKGPVAVLVPLAVTFLFCLARRDLRIWARGAFDPRGLVLFGLTALPWYLAILGREGWSFVHGFFLTHNVDRFRGALDGHTGSLGYYVPIVLIGTLPFTAYLVRVAIRVKTAWRDDLEFYLLLWFGFVFVFFSLSGTKLPHYVLYGMTGLFILMAVYGREVRGRLWALLPALLFFLFLLALPQLGDVAAPLLRRDYDYEAVARAAGAFGIGYVAFVASAAVLTVWLMVDARFDLPSQLVFCSVLAVIAL